MAPKPLCARCGEKPVARRMNKCCSPSCASLLRWEAMKQDGRATVFLARMKTVKLNRYTERVRVEAKREMEALGVPYGPATIKLYMRARHKGYHAGYMTAQQRVRLGLLKGANERPVSERLQSPT